MNRTNKILTFIVGGAVLVGLGVYVYNNYVNRGIQDSTKRRRNINIVNLDK